MRAIGIAAALVAATAMVTGCASIGRSPVGKYLTAVQGRTPVEPPPGVIYTHHKAPLDTSPGKIGSRKGTATSHQIATPPIPGIAPAFPLISWGDASVKTAASNGGISDVSQTDYELTVILMLYRRFTTEVYGD